MAGCFGERGQPDWPPNRRLGKTGFPGQMLGHSTRAKLSLAAEVLIVAAAYFACGWFGLSLASIHKSASPVWPPTGLALSVLLMRGRRLWPAIFLGAFLVNILKP